MDEITLDDKIYVSSKRAAKITGYAKDYVGQLCREGKVEARLIGRNWYILESSIREHRFGAPQMTAKEVPLEENVSTYTADTSPELLPTLTPHPISVPFSTPTVDTLVITQEKTPVIDEMPPVELITPELKPLSTSIVQDMQSAWQDWFSRTDELKVSEETLLEESYSEEADEAEEPSQSNEQQELIEEQTSQYKTKEVLFEAGTMPITLEKVENVPQEEEIVPIKRTYAPQIQTQQAPIQHLARPVVSSVTSIPNTVPLPQGRILRERRIIVSKKKPSAFLQVVFLLITLIVIGGTLISSGALDAFAAKYNIQYTLWIL